MSELRTSVKIGSARWVLTGVGGGAGVAIALAVTKALSQRPEFLPQLLNGQFLFFASLMAGMLLFRGEIRNFNAMQERHVVAQEKLAANVGDLVAKDDERAREQDLTLTHLARNTDSILELQRTLKREFDDLKRMKQ